MAIGAISNGFDMRAYLASAGKAMAGGVGTEKLTPQQQQQLRELKATDRKVRDHEAAHQAAGAGLTGGASFQYVRGPDGKQYAVGGEVSIDVSPAQSPEQTIYKARQIQVAALAPADPSSQDRAVAAAAAQMQVQAQAELNRQRQAEQQQSRAGDVTANAMTVPGDGRAGSEALAAYAALEPAPAPTLSLFA
jgi:hypothetical protein